MLAHVAHTWRPSTDCDSTLDFIRSGPGGERLDRECGSCFQYLAPVSTIDLPGVTIQLQVAAGERVVA